MLALGTVRPGSTIYIPFATFDGGTGASITMSGLALGDLLVWKDGGTTQRASTAGFTLLDTDGIDFDGVTGIHGVSIDLADNTTAGFWAAGSKYFLAISTITVDGQTVSFLAATWDIGYPAAVLNTTIATLASQTSFTLTAGPAENDALNNMTVVIHDVASAVQLGQATVSAYTGATKTVTLSAGTTFTAAATDNIAIFLASGGSAPSAATVAAAVWDKARSAHTTAGTFGEYTPANTTHWGGTAVASANVLIDGAITAAKIAADAITDAKVASDVTIASVTGAVGSVTGAVGSVTGAVGSVTGAVGSVTAAVTVGTNNDKTGYGLSAAAVQAIWDALASALTTVGSIGKRLVDYLTGDAFARLGAPAGASTAADIAAIKTETAQIAADLPSRITKNTALSAFMFMMVDSTDHVTAETGLTVTATRSIDGAAFASCANAVSEVANGWYKIDLAAADLNGNVIALRFTATGADTRNITIVTQP